jgi:prepilin-type processing-associated H-X9-DG protein
MCPTFAGTYRKNGNNAMNVPYGMSWTAGRGYGFYKKITQIPSSSGMIVLLETYYDLTTHDLGMAHIDYSTVGRGRFMHSGGRITNGVFADGHTYSGDFARTYDLEGQADWQHTYFWGSGP